jgi:hypothetical protein
MSTPAFKRLAMVLSVFCTLLLFATCVLYWNHTVLRVQAAFADEQMQVFDQMRSRALESISPPDIAGFLQYVLMYYPSGTKQRTGSKLDRVVERHRTAVVRDIIAHLRRITGEDLGESPEPWVRKYAQIH